MSKHTPGPWFVTDGPQYGYNKLKRVNSASGKFGTVICERFSAEGVEGLKEEVEANLTLIAASPDMLTALKLVAAQPGFEEEEEYGIAVLTAIAKATQL